MTTPELPITAAELEALADHHPELIRQFLQLLLRLRNQDALPAEPPPLARWEPLLSFADACRPRPPTPYLVERLLPLPSLSLFYGPPGVMKSLALMDLALCVASGRPWLKDGSLPSFKVLPAPVLWLDLDQGEDLMCERLAALGRGLAVQPEQVRFSWKSILGLGFNIQDPAQVEELATLSRRLEARLLCIDNLGMAKGDADENTDRMIPVMSHLRLLSEQCRAAVVVLHHARKETGFKSRYGEASRGHTSIAASVDLSLSFEREDQQPLIRLRAGKARRRPLTPFSILFNLEHRPASDELERAWFEGVSDLDDRPASSSAAQGRALDEALLKILDKGPANQAQLVDQVTLELPQFSQRAIVRRIHFLAERGRITGQRGLRNSCLYSLSERIV